MGAIITRILEISLLKLSKLGGTPAILSEKFNFSRYIIKRLIKILLMFYPHNLIISNPITR